MKLLVARSTIAIQNMLWIAICIVDPQNISQTFEINLRSFLLLILRLHGTRTTNDNTNTKTRQNEIFFRIKVRFSDAQTYIK